MEKISKQYIMNGIWRHKYKITIAQQDATNLKVFENMSCPFLTVKGTVYVIINDSAFTRFTYLSSYF